ncbi:MAG: 1-aminocyclopropane-1-carboxylate deaminase/D-cysteine desulfhydrase [Winogradskyella sp.]|uniref:1-aminocyclopropane-1-carboxylate deaminase/D-cysteine desulfhydrase n=1 Tax=Winogradskyella sp. TaxID=1883156 RepID=UPI000F3F0631|nr:pyridoxal-phosphate dependent enzyme [Winogradskyella sp.]RNC87632.1 MAG: 1-aminocyclopropane-1-carboxylate deaminase/D-cysteine desulfhydrase [Winogradskyella sp.]
MTSPLEEIHIKNDANIQLYIKREDLLHPHISGNKYRKLKYNLQEAKQKGKDTLLTFGGAFSNHIAASAYAGKLNGLRTIGVIRGEELKSKISTNPTLSFAQECGMIFYFMSREAYRKKEDPDILNQLYEKYGDFYLIPEGGTNTLAVKGCEDILDDSTKKFNYICTSVGTGGTISGIINASETHQKILGFPALKGAFLSKEITKFATKTNWQLIPGYNFGGYAKINTELITFINDFKSMYNISLDPIYTGKMMFGILDMIALNQFEENSKILAIHTGGLQGILGMNQRLKAKSMPQIKV